LVPDWFWAVFAASVGSIPPLLVFLTLYTSRKSLQRDEVIRTLRARVETLEQERNELQAKIEELEERLREEERRHLEEMKRREAEWAERLRKQEEACEARVREASRLSSTARTLFEAFRAGVVEISVKGEECDEIEVQPGKILCCRGGECRVVWPEKSTPGEEVVVVRKRAGQKRKQPKQPQPKREEQEEELEEEVEV